MLNPDFWLDEELANLSPHARLLYMGLWGICDDNYATFPNRPLWVKAQVFPYEEVNTRQLLDELSTSTRIILFRDENGEEFYYIKNFFKYQRVDRPSNPKYPQYEPEMAVLDEPSMSPRPEVKLSKDKIREVKLREENTLPLKTNPYSKLDDVTEQDMDEISQHYQVPIAFVKSKYEDMCLWVGEKAGRDRGRNWKLTLMNWVKRDGMKIVERSKGDPSKRAVDATTI